jgi:predicted DNA-binding transcriptional regulator YafY
LRASRLIALLLTVQARHKVTASELAASLSVSIRTVYRDIEALQEAGVPIYGAGGQDGGYRLVDGYRTRLTGLTECEAEALFLSLLPGPASSLGFSGYADTARLKALAALPGLVASRLAARFLLDGTGWRADAPGSVCLPLLAQAVKADQAIALSGQPVEPYGIVLDRGIWYLVGHDGTSFDIYPVAAFDPRTLTVLSAFRRDESFSLRDYWSANSASQTRAPAVPSSSGQ